MKSVRVGYKRLYNSRGCSLQSDKPIDIELQLSDFRCQVYIGDNPHLGISVASGSNYYVLGESAPIGSMSFGRADVSKVTTVGLLTEICCSKEIEIDENAVDGFYKGDSACTQSLLGIVESQAASFKENLDLVAGTIGLRFHRQFVIETLAENAVACNTDGTPAQPLHGNVVEVLEPLSMKESGTDVLQTMLKQVSNATQEAQTFGASALRWLLRSWHERDPFARFMSLFIPLEVVLSAVKYDNEEKAQQRAIDQQIESLLRDHGGQESVRLISEYKKIRQLVHPPLSARFEHLAETAQIAGWQTDIAAFKRFNSMRNGILHNGKNAFELIITVGDNGETRSLEDLAERYVLWVLFRSKEPYKSRYRPVRPTEGN